MFGVVGAGSRLRDAARGRQRRRMILFNRDVLGYPKQLVVTPLTSSLDPQRNHKDIRYGFYKPFGPPSDTPQTLRCINERERTI